MVTVLICAPWSRSSGYRYIPVPKTWHAPVWWLGHPTTRYSRSTGAWCIHEHEGAWNSNTGNGYGGGLQFLPGTWERAGGGRMSTYQISRQSPRTQLFRAWTLWNKDGRSWREWGTAHKCGLH